MIPSSDQPVEAIDRAADRTGSAAQRPGPEPIAIVGIGCRFPGGVGSPDEYWRLLSNGVDAIAEIPPDRMDVETLFDSRPATPGKIMTRWGGFLEGIDQFDAGFFQIAPVEADRLDPQQRLLLEVAQEALDDAGLIAGDLQGSRTGVFVGLWLNDYEARLFEDPATTDFYMTTGSGRYAASGRISYTFGFEGPSISLDTACSSSLVAVHLACRSLKSGECDLALAAGANVILRPHIHIAYSQSKMMAPDGRCKFGDARADGYVRSEGAGVVVLKRLSDAVRDQDPVYAVILGSAVNNDGRGSGYLATPSREGQEALLRQAYRDAHVAPADVQYVEAHGTGTRAGDPVELEALGDVLGAGRPADRPCLVGSVKTNFGHTEGAAGVAGLIKVALSLKHRAIPATLHLQKPNPVVPWEKLHLTVPTQLKPWPGQPGTAVAGVSAFGIAGTNAHVVLADAPSSTWPAREAQEPEREHILPLSAHSPEALEAVVRQFKDFLAASDGCSIPDIWHTAARRRSHQEYRLSVVGRTRDELIERLSIYIDGEVPASIATNRAEPDRRPGVVFVFPGQGSQWFGMGRELLAKEPAFREAIGQCERAIRPFVDWSLSEQIAASERDSRLNEIGVIQPALFSIQVSLSALWRSWGVEPDAVIGHSMGEVAAAHVAGALSLEDAARIISLRSKLLQRISGRGVMAVVGLPIDQARQRLAGFEDQLSIAVSNSPRSTVLSGDPPAMERVLETLAAENIFTRLIKVDVASHSPQVDVLKADLMQLLESVRPSRSAIPIYSTVTGEISDGATFDATYWARNLRQPVLFSKMVQRLVADGTTAFLELSAHPILLSAIEENLHHLHRTGLTIPSLRREKPERETMLSSLGALYTVGFPVDWGRQDPSIGRVVHLPNYPWQRRRHWLEPGRSTSGDSSEWLAGASRRAREHPLLGHRLPALAHLPNCHAWQNSLDGHFRRYIESHGIENPIEAMAMAAATTVFGEKTHAIRQVTIEGALTPADSSTHFIQTVMNRAAEDSLSIQIFSREQQQSNDWLRRAEVQVEPGRAQTDWFYDLEWQAKPRAGAPASSGPRQTGCWLVFSDEGGFGSALSLRLASLGLACVNVFAGSAFAATERGFLVNPGRLDDFRQVLAEVRRTKGCPVTGIVLLWPLDAPDSGQPASSSVEGLVEAFVHLIQAVADSDAQPAAPIWLVSRGAQSVQPIGSPSLSQAPLWGLGRVAALEHPDLLGGMLDLDSSRSTPNGFASEVERIMPELLEPDGENQIAFRGDERFVSRLVRRTTEVRTVTPLVIRPDATYLITGGLGSLGLKAARWLVQQGATQLVLTSRSGLPERSQRHDPSGSCEVQKRIAAVRELESLGAGVRVARADVSDLSEMSALFAEVERDCPPLRGILHAAGVAGTSPIRSMSADSLRSILRAKVTGTWVLHQLSEAMKAEGKGLDFFVMYSSGASVWGSQGLAHYAAANAYLDALAHYRSGRGLPALSVNWGLWAGEGIATGELARQFAQVGLRGMHEEQALAALKYLLEIGAVQRSVADIDWPTFRPIYEARNKQPLLEQIEIEEKERPEAPKDGAGAGFLRRLKEARPGDRWDLLLAHVREETARVLGFASPDLLDVRQGFFKMGMDSIMTVRLRNALNVGLECNLPPTAAFEYPNVEALSTYLFKEVLALKTVESEDQVSDVDVVGQASTDAADDEAKARLDSLSKEELLQLLDDELSAMDD